MMTCNYRGFEVIVKYNEIYYVSTVPEMPSIMDFAMSAEEARDLSFESIDMVLEHFPEMKKEDING